jgi:hypothetical protein
MRRAMVSAVKTRPVPWQVWHASVMFCKWLWRTRCQGHLDQAKVAHRECLGPGAVTAEVRAELLQHLVAVRLRLHVDEVAGR